MSAKQVTVIPAKQQHMLFLFVPIKKGVLAANKDIIEKMNSGVQSALSVDPRKATGVHYFMTYPHLEGTPTPGIPGAAGFASYPGKDVLVVMSLYDNDFAPYISAFFFEPVLSGLNFLLTIMDETGIPGVDPNGPHSANYIHNHGGVKANAAAFYCMLMQYNFGDPVLPAGGTKPTDRYTLGTNFPGLTVADIINNYPGAASNWPPPSEPQNTYTFPKGIPPVCKK